jgi:hypothetical protein
MNKGKKNYAPPKYCKHFKIRWLSNYKHLQSKIVNINVSIA